MYYINFNHVYYRTGTVLLTDKKRYGILAATLQKNAYRWTPILKIIIELDKCAPKFRLFVKSTYSIPWVCVKGASVYRFAASVYRYAVLRDSKLGVDVFTYYVSKSLPFLRKKKSVIYESHTGCVAMESWS